MPQPYRGKDTIEPSAKALLDRPDLAAKVSTVIALYSEAEAFLAGCFASVLGIEESAALEIYLLLIGAGPKASAMSVVMNGRLTDVEQKIFDGIRQRLGAFSGRRNDFAHGVWCDVDGFGVDKIALASARDFVRFMHVVYNYDQTTNPPDAFPVMVYTAKELEGMIADLRALRNEAYGLSHELHQRRYLDRRSG